MPSNIAAIRSHVESPPVLTTLPPSPPLPRSIVACLAFLAGVVFTVVILGLLT